MDEALINMIAEGFPSFSVVEDEGFKEYIAALDPSYVLPSRYTISERRLPNLQEKLRGELKESIQNATAVCLTKDCRTSAAATSYRSVTCHSVEAKSSSLDRYI